MAEKKMAGKQAPKTSAGKPLSKGDVYLCEICGLQVNVDLCGEFLATKNLSCCNKSMKKKTK